MKQLLLVDGYNIIHDWPELRALTEKTGLDAARDRLLETLADYSGVISWMWWWSLTPTRPTA